MHLPGQQSGAPDPQLIPRGRPRTDPVPGPSRLLTGLSGTRGDGEGRRARAGMVRNAGGTHLRMMPPRREALRHSGGASRRRTSATFTLYFELEASSERRPGTLQKRSDGCRPLGSSASLSSHSALTPPAGTDSGVTAAAARGMAGAGGGPKRRQLNEKAALSQRAVNAAVTNR